MTWNKVRKQMYVRWSCIQKERNYVIWTNKLQTNDYSLCLHIVVHALDITQMFTGAWFVLCEDNVLPHFGVSWNHWGHTRFLLSFQLVLLLFIFLLHIILTLVDYKYFIRWTIYITSSLYCRCNSFLRCQKLTQVALGSG